MARAALALLLIACLPATSRAQDAPLEGEVREGYETLVRAALEEFQGGRWRESRALFRQAHALEPNARTLRGIAMASFELREYAEARRACAEALAEPRRALTEAQRAQVEALLRRTEAFVARLELALEPADARVVVDGAPVELDAEGAIHLDFGAHEVVVQAPEHAPATRRWSVRGGERERWEVRLEPLVELRATPEVEVALDDGIAPVLTVPDRTMPDRTLAHGLLVASAVVVVGAVVSFALSVEREGELGRCVDVPCVNEGSLRDQRDAATGLGVGLTTVALGLAAVGLALWLGEREPSSAIACGVGPASLVCVGRFGGF